MKEKFREMHENMQDPLQQQPDFSTQPNSAEKSASKKQKEDYIDFEEIK